MFSLYFINFPHLKTLFLEAEKTHLSRSLSNADSNKETYTCLKLGNESQAEVAVRRGLTILAHMVAEPRRKGGGGASHIPGTRL